MANKGKQQTFSDHFKGIEFYPQYEKNDLEDVLDKPYMVKDALVVKGFHTSYGDSDFALILLQDLETQEHFTTICGGMVVIKKIEQAKAERLLPLIGTICKPAQYYDII